MASPQQRRLAVLEQQLTQHQQANLLLQAHPTAARQHETDSSMFAGRVIVITGAAKGIGEAAALAFAKRGAQLLLTDLDNQAVQITAERCRASGSPKVVAMAGDITSSEAPGTIAEAIRAEFGRIDVLVNNAGYTWDGVIHKMSDKQWGAMLDVHVSAPFRLVRALSPLFRDAAKAEQEASGTATPRCIINISSTSGTHGNSGQANYAAAKAGIVGFTKTVAKEWGHLGVRCNAIAYGMIDTRLTRNKEGGEAIIVGGEKVKLGIPGADALRDLAMATVPLARVGTADEAACAILMLASPWANYITGQVLEVNGGSYM